MTDSIDTNIILRCILGDVPEQRHLAARLLRTPNTTHYLSSQALLECIYVMEIVEEIPREEIVDLLNFFLTRYSDVLEYNQKITALAFPLYLARPKLSWADCALTAEAEFAHHEPLFTFDKKLATQLPQAKLLKETRDAIKEKE
ncbi:type II toxin-antitoxin system VapC family toxin [Candidatus Saccharibacteria bacterium]|nr:type II toxin-antitoxin system VapC family toxin [Candidatus Saccharibacteria bacterium]MBQ6375901.1 type II toxin-antitoxin system VapC family toxin [Candidatus Saccharibacteria bacterium]